MRLEYTADNHKEAVREASKNPDPKDQKVKHFWAMIVWNYSTEKIEILEITQKSLQETLRNLSVKKGWGNPVKTYDLSVDRSWSWLETEYQLAPIPPYPLDPAIENELAKTKVNLQALFYGVDPFNETWTEPISADDFITE